MALGPLSSQLNERTEAANRRAAERCLAEPALLAEVSAGLSHENAALVGDCAEVMTMVATGRPDLVAPYAEQLAPLLDHRKTRVRWEALHALALAAHLVPHVVEPRLDQLARLLETDSSTIVRDYAVDCLANYARVGPQEARLAYPHLLTGLSAAEGKHAARALRGLGAVTGKAPELADDILTIARQHVDHDRGVVRKAAAQVLKSLYRQ